MAEEVDLLDSLLSVATEELEKLEEKLDKKENFVLKETDIFQLESNLPNKETNNTPKILKTLSTVHNGDTDSSDDEGNRNYEDKKYNECGRSIKKTLLSDSPTVSPFRYGQPKRVSTWKTNPNGPKSTLSIPKVQIDRSKQVADVYTDPVFGLRIINPLISSTVLQDRMVGREAVPFCNISRHIQVFGKDKDWVIAGVIASKSVKTSQKGSQFAIWTLTDLKDDIKTVALFLFSGAYKDLWKLTVGTVVGVLNPNVLDKRDGAKDEAALSVDNAQKVMVFGQSKDFGTCKSIKKNGEKCTVIVNVNRCEFCIYHIKQEYQKCSKRSELQSNFSGKGLTALRNKVLGKNEVFYAGKSYMAIPAKRSKKLEQKDQSRLQSLNLNGAMVSNSIVKTKNPPKKKQNARCLDISQAQRIRDMELLKKLGGYGGLDNKTNFSNTHSSKVSLEESKSVALNVIEKLKKNKTEVAVKPASQFNLKSDLILNVDGKNNFAGNISESVSLEESKAVALNVIAKLKNKNQQKQEQPKENVVNVPESNTDDIFGDDIDLDYDDDDLGKSNESKSLSKKETNKISTQKVASSSPNALNKSKNSMDENKELLSNISSSSISSLESPKTISKAAGTNNKMLQQNTNLNGKPSIAMDFPTLSGFGSRKPIDLSSTVTPRHINRAKLNALKFIERNGPIKKVDPNSTKGTGKKRPIEQTGNENAAKKSKLQESEFISDRFKKMMAATSKHVDLLESYDNDQQDKYFNKLEVKEQMEEKMANTYKVACKAVRCLKCKYTSFSASDLCKTERHPLKVFDAMKRFFKCGNCGNRTVSLNIIPTQPCKNCGSGKWERTGMMKEKTALMAHTLSIRGGEQKFLNSVATDANINLLVPDD